MRGREPARGCYMRILREETMINRFGTVSLWVDDFDNCIPFYRDILGLELTTRPGEVPHFLVGESMLVLVKGDFCPPEEAFPPDFP